MKQDLDLKTPTELMIKVEQVKFLENVVFPRFYQQDTKYCFNAVHNIDGRVLAAHDYFANYLGLKNKEQLINQLPNELGFTKNLNCLFWEKFNTGIHKSQADLFSLIKTRDGLLCSSCAKPIKDRLGNVFAFQTYTENVNGDLNYSIVHKNCKRFMIDDFILNNVFDFKFDDRDSVILCMLINGFTQNQIADYYDCSRSLIQKRISESLCIKFGLWSGSARILVEKAIEFGYAHYIPRELLYLNKHNNLSEQQSLPKLLNTNFYHAINELSIMEKTILEMLCQQYKQREIADFLHQSRSLVAKVISTKICPQFDITNGSSRLLIEYLKCISLSAVSR